MYSDISRWCSTVIIVKRSTRISSMSILKSNPWRDAKEQRSEFSCPRSIWSCSCTMWRRESKFHEFFAASRRPIWFEGNVPNTQRMRMRTTGGPNEPRPRVVCLLEPVFVETRFGSACACKVLPTKARYRLDEYVSAGLA
jgi:hypothetical protein